MAEYIEKETLDSELYNRFHDEDEPSNITDVRLGSVRNFVRDFPTADVVEREKIDKAIEEITNLSRYQDGIDTMNVGDDLMISWCKTLDILKEI